jgi:cyclopropane-fatty-acyl-phospholipid synthase
MNKNSTKKILEDLLEHAGVHINGKEAYDIQIHDEHMLDRIIHEQTLGLGETYMDKAWDVQALDEFFYRLARIDLERHFHQSLLKHYQFWLGGLHYLFYMIKQRLFNYQSKLRAFQIGKEHYDLGNDLFIAMLDKELTYTCGYWKDATDLYSAQQAKLKLVCEKLQLQPKQKILDIGCGWGSFARYAVQHYDVSVVGVTVSKNQCELAQQLCKGMPIDIRLQDYRDLHEKFDHIVSLGMFEHVGYKNYRTYMQVVHRNLKEDGLFLLHTIGNNKTYYCANEWLQKYIFPNSTLPSIQLIAKAIEGLFVMEDWHNFGADYDKTAMAWHKNFNDHWDELKSHYSERFYRMWSYFLLSCAGAFRARQLQLWQVVLSKNGKLGGYQSVR